MKYLFIHKDLPGQFEHVIRSLALDRGNEIVCICQSFAPQQYPAFGLRILTYDKAETGGPNSQPFLYSSAESVANGLAVASKLAELNQSGFVPDIAVAHLGWGESIYFKDIYPSTPLVGYCEFYHHARGVDADFDPEFPVALNDIFRIRTANATKLLGLVGIDVGISPTRWQKGLFPAEFQRKIRVIHEGVDTSRFKPDPDAVLRLRNGRSLSRSQPVITYSARNLEPYRGFHSFMRAVADICRRRTDCQIVVAGGDEVSYSAIRSHETYRERMIREVGIDPERVHFVGTLPLDDYVKLLQISSVHIYLTVPFVLSWSLLEAMATGCVIVGSNTAPVREVLTHAHNGLLVDFFSPREIADMVDRVLDHPNRGQPLGLQARADVVGSFDVTQSVRHYQELFEQLLANARCMRGAA